MIKPTEMIMLAALVRWATGCSSSDDQAPSGEEDSSGSSYEDDLKACQEATLTLRERECRLGFTPGMVGPDSSIVPPEAAVIPICGDAGVLIVRDALRDAELVGYDITRNSVCAYGCFTECGPRTNTCAGRTAMGGRCGFCGTHLDEQSCQELLTWCQEIDAEDTGTGGDACGSGSTGSG
jgi:hypothetical protein